jgi:hypothetical protein
LRRDDRNDSNIAADPLLHPIALVEITARDHSPGLDTAAAGGETLGVLGQAQSCTHFCHRSSAPLAVELP